MAANSGRTGRQGRGAVQSDGSSVFGSAGRHQGRNNTGQQSADVIVEHADGQSYDIWAQTWNEFNRALRSPEPFEAFTWVFRLGNAAMKSGYYRSGLYRLRLHLLWRPLMPIFAVLLIILILASYFTFLRDPIKQRWCCPPNSESASYTTGCTDEDCSWMIVHDMIVAYLGIMILFNFVTGCIRSPGVALPTLEGVDNISTSNNAPPQFIWTAFNGQGGCLGFNPKVDVHAERRRVTEYNEMAKRIGVSNNGNMDDNFPSTRSTTCIKCNITRPARCHHCSACNRCILQYDHHCIWLNNCVGYNNYRPFVLTLFFLTVGGCYGTGMLFFPFYLHLKQQIPELGFRALFSFSRGFLNNPPPWTLIHQMIDNDLDPIVIIKIVYPILFFVGIVQALFLSSHIRYMLKARTTLEHQIILDQQYAQLLQGNTRYTPPPNPFDSGWYSNVTQVLGRNLFLVFLPVPIAPSLSERTKRH